MRKLVTLLSCFAISILLSFNVLAQKGLVKNADESYKNHEWFHAIELYKKAYTASGVKKDEKARIIFQIGECYRMMGDSKQEVQWYSKAVKSKYDDPLALLYLANAQMQQSNYDDAVETYKQYKDKVPSDPRGAAGIKWCQDAQKMKNTPTRYVVANMGQLNTKFRDFSPCFSNRRYDELIFTSDRPGGTGDKMDVNTGDTYSDLYIAKEDKNGKWSAPVPLPAPVNTPANEGSCCFTKDFKKMYFTRCDNVKNLGKHCKIFSTDRRGTTWTDPQLLAFQIDSITYGHPTVSADGLELFFSSNLPGGMGGLDIWMAKYNKKLKQFENPTNLGSDINTPGNDVYPFLNMSTGDLYFSSDGRGGFGGLDIFKAVSKGTDKWGDVTNMGTPVNSEADDFGIQFEGNKDRGYLSSNRQGGRGSDDIWAFYMPPILFVIEGVVRDIDTKKGIKSATVRLVGSDGSDVSQKTDTGGYYNFGANGTLKRFVEAGNSYIISAEAKDLNYIATQNVRANESTVGFTESHTFKHDFDLQIIKPELHFPEVLFPLDSFNLRPQYRDSLQYLVKLLNNNPTITIELDAHTDQRGDYNHNIKLSQNRAQSCVNYLISAGVDSARVTAKGWGYTKPAIDIKTILAEKDPVKREELYHKNRRTVFQVIRFNYIPKGRKLTAEDSLKIEAIKKAKLSGEEIEDTSEVAPQELPAGGSNPAPPANNNQQQGTNPKK